MAVRFDASGEQLTRALGLGSQTTFTLMCWAKIDVDRNAFSTALIVDSGAAADSMGFQTSSDGTTMRWISDDANAATMAAMTVGTWYVLALVTDSTTAGRSYIRAASASSFTSVNITGVTGPWTMTNVRIGSSVNTEWLNGSVCGVKIWTAALTEAEIEREAMAYMPYRTESLVAWYPLLAPADTTDYSGGAQTLSGGAGAAVDDGPGIPWRPVTRRLWLPSPSGPAGVSGVAGWWKADSLTQSDNTAVSSWPDSSGGGHAATQGTGGNQPVFRTNVLNGKPVIRFDGTDDFLDATIADDAQPSTWFVVFKCSDALRSVQIFQSAQEVMRHESGNLILAFAGTDSWNAYTHDGSAWQILTTVFNGASSTFRVNGDVTGQSISPGTNATGTTLRIGGHTALSRYLAGDIAELILYDRELTAGERSQIHSYLSEKYAITVADYSGEAQASLAITASFTAAPTPSTVRPFRLRRPAGDGSHLRGGDGLRGPADVTTAVATASLPVTATLTAATVAERPAQASLAVTASLSAAAVATRPADASLAITASLSAAATRTATVAASLPVTASLAASAARDALATATLAATATLTAAAEGLRPAVASLPVTATLSAAATRTALIEASLSATATLTAGLTRTALIDASLPITATLTAAATVGTPPVTIAASLSITSTLTAGMLRTAEPTAALSVTATLSAAGARDAPAQAGLPIVATLSAGFHLEAAAAATLVITAVLVATAERTGDIIFRPFTGTTTRPGTGTIIRPDTGLVLQP